MSKDKEKQLKKEEWANRLSILAHFVGHIKNSVDEQSDKEIIDDLFSLRQRMEQLRDDIKRY